MRGHVKIGALGDKLDRWKASQARGHDGRQRRQYRPRRQAASPTAAVSARQLCPGSPIVADLVWRFTRHTDESNHFGGDMDKPGKDGKTAGSTFAPSSTRNVDPKVWNDYYTGSAKTAAGAAVPVWQDFDEMVEYAAANQAGNSPCAARHRRALYRRCPPAARTSSSIGSRSERQEARQGAQRVRDHDDRPARQGSRSR